MENSVKKPEVLHVQHAVVNVNGELEGVERQPADRKHHDLQHTRWDVTVLVKLQ